MRVPILILLFLTSALSAFADEVFFNGAVAIVASSENAKFGQHGAGLIAIDRSELPVFRRGYLSLDCEYGEFAFLHTVNDVDFEFTGPGELSVERFDVSSEFLDPAAIEGEGSSRFVLNMRQGRLILDSSEMSGERQLIVETPVGRLYAPDGLIQVQIEYDYRRGIYDFLIACANGSVRFVDQSGESYLLYRGQRIAGAGSFMAPSIEVGELSADTIEQFDLFVASRGSLNLDELGQSNFRQLMTEMAGSRVAQTVGGDQSQKQLILETSKRPIVIDYASPPRPMNPFRANVKPPSESEKQIF